MDHFGMACRALGTVSRYATVKTGDVISPWWMPAGVIPQVGGSLVAALNGQECLNVKIR